MSEINQMTDNWEESLEPIYSNDTELTKDICDFLKCSEYKHGNESEPTACYGCDAMYDIFYQEEKRIIEDDDKYNYIQSLLDKKAEEVFNDIGSDVCGNKDMFEEVMRLGNNIKSEYWIGVYYVLKILKQKYIKE